MYSRAIISIESQVYSSFTIILVWYYHSPVRFPMSPHRRSIIIKPMFLLSMFSIMVMVLLVFGDDLDLEILKVCMCVYL